MLHAHVVTEVCNKEQGRITALRPSSKCASPYPATQQPVNSDVLLSWLAECGHASANGQAFIVNGRNATVSESPWHVGLYLVPNNYEQVCGGTLIHPRVVVTGTVQPSVLAFLQDPD